jgi:hypothetical protein
MQTGKATVLGKTIAVLLVFESEKNENYLFTLLKGSGSHVCHLL